MRADLQDNESFGGGQERFLTTHWSVVIAAGGETSAQSAQALEALCRAYWYPLYAHVRRQGHDVHEAQDLTQEFFARLLEKRFLGQVKRERGKFRSFLLAALKHFLCNEWDRKSAQKRGGGKVVISLDDELAEERLRLEERAGLSPEEQFEKAWAVSLLEQAMLRLEGEQCESGREEAFRQLKTYLSGAPARGDYERLSASLGLSANTIAVTVNRLRQRYRQLIELEVANTVSDRGAVQEEMSHILQILAR